MPVQHEDTERRAFTTAAVGIDAFVGRVSFLTAMLASLLILTMMLLISADVVSRNLFSTPISGVAGFVSYAVVASVFLQICSAIRNNRLISAEFLAGPLRRKAPALGLALSTLFSLSAIVVLFFAAHYLWKDFTKAYTTSEFVGATGAFKMFVWPFKFAVATGASLALIELVLLVIREYLKHPGVRNSVTRWIIAAVSLMAFLIAYNLLAQLAQIGFDRVAIGFGALVLLLVLISFGMPIVFALMVTSFIGIWLVRGNMEISINSIGNSSASAVRSYGYGVIPLFVMMGLLLDKAGVGRDAFQIMALLARRLTGGLGIATVAANAIFASITGSSIASATVFSRIAVAPMMDSGYSKKFALGIVAGSSVLGMLIPPSLLMIVYGLLAETSIGDLFIAGIIPGLLLALIFSLTIVGLAHFAPGFAGNTKGTDGLIVELTMQEVISRLLPILFIVALVMGGIYGGIFSPTEAGAVGALGALIVAVARRSINFDVFKGVVLETGAITAGLLFLMISANVYGRMLAMTTIPMELTQIIGSMSLSLIGFVILYMLLVMFLGMILDSVSIMLIVLPIALPILIPLDGNLIWFGIITVLAVEIGLLTPPFGLSVYVVKGSLPPGFASLTEIFTAAAPFVIAMIFVTLLIIFFPWIATALT